MRKPPLIYHYKKTIPAIKLTLLSIILSTLQGCDDAKLKDRKDLANIPISNAIDSYRGCLTGEAIDLSQNRLTVEVIPGAEGIRILRDGAEVHSNTFEAPATEANEYEFVDQGTFEAGREYHYMCFMTIAGNEVLGKINRSIKGFSNDENSTGTDAKKVTDVPLGFSGLAAVEKLGKQAVKLTWTNLPKVSTKYFKIFYGHGSKPNWNIPTQTINGDQSEVIIESLGDEIDYFFAVRSCDAEDHCDENEKIMTTSIEDLGAPQIAKITSIEKEENGFYLLAPWTHEHGAVKTRKVFRKTDELSNNIEDYGDYGPEGLVFESPNGITPPQKLFISLLESFKTYHFVVRDYDTKGQVSAEITPFTLETGDIQTTNWASSLLKQSSPIDKFLGVSSVVEGDSDGELIVHWNNLSDLNGYFGFRIYDADKGLKPEDAIGVCLCLNNKCMENAINSCSVKLNPGQGYRLIVRAYGTDDKESDNMATTNSPVYAPDKTGPVFPETGSPIKAQYDETYNKIKVQFKLATDNNFAATAQSIEYKIYKKFYPGRCAGRGLADIQVTEENLLTKIIPAEGVTLASAYEDHAYMTSKTAYLYRITATDQANLDASQSDRRNTTIDNSFACVETSEIYYPQFVGGDSCREILTAGGCPSVALSEPMAPRWAVSWDMKDPLPNGADKSTIESSVYVTYSQDAHPPAIKEDLSDLTKNYTLERTETGVTRYPSNATAFVYGPTDKNTWVHYAVVLTKKNEGVVTHRTVATSSIYSQNSLALTSVTRSNGTHLGGKLVMIRGSGLTPSTDIYFGDKTDETKKCLEPKMIETTNRQDPRIVDQLIMCKTPAWTLPSGQNEEKVQIFAKNNMTVSGEPIWSSDQIEYTFYDPAAANNFNELCDIAANHSKAFANSPADAADEPSFGIVDNPYIICNAAQLSHIDITENNGMQYYKLGDNIDLSAIIPWHTLNTLYYTGLSLDGDNFAIYGLNLDAKLSWSDPGNTFPFVGLFSILGINASVKNLLILDAKIKDDNTSPEMSDNSSYTHMGFIAGWQSSPDDKYSIFPNITLQGTIKGVGKVSNQRVIGGLFGRAASTYPENPAMLASTTIENLSVNLESIGQFEFAWFGGIASMVDQNIKNFDVKNAAIRIKSSRLHYVMGGVAAYHFGDKSANFENVKVYLNVTNDDFVEKDAENFGGIIGRLHWGSENSTSKKEFKNIHVYGSVDPGDKKIDYMGGIVGELHGTQLLVENSEVELTIKSNVIAGGFIGQSFRYSSSPAVDEDYNIAEGLPVGTQLSLQIKNSRFSGQIYPLNKTNPTTATGGFIGRTMMNNDKSKVTIRIKDSIFDGKIIARNDNGLFAHSCIGGIIGGNGGSLEQDMMIIGYIPENVIVDNVAVLGNIYTEGITNMIGGAFGVTFGTADDLDQTVILIDKSFIAPQIMMDKTAGSVGGISGMIIGTNLSISNSIIETKLYDKHPFSEDPNIPYPYVGGVIGYIMNTNVDDPRINLSNVVSRTILRDFEEQNMKVYGVVGVDFEEFEKGTVTYDISDVYFDLSQTDPNLVPDPFHRDIGFNDIGRTSEFLNTEANFDKNIWDSGIWTWENGKLELHGIIQLLSSFPGN